MSDLDLVVLGGAGHVGLPFSLVAANAGLRVGVFDTKTETLDTTRSGQMPFMEARAGRLLTEVLQTGRLELSNDASMIGRTDILIVVIGTTLETMLTEVVPWIQAEAEAGQI